MDIMTYDKLESAAQNEPYLGSAIQMLSHQLGISLDAIAGFAQLLLMDGPGITLIGSKAPDLIVVSNRAGTAPGLSRAGSFAGGGRGGAR